MAEERDYDALEAQEMQEMAEDRLKREHAAEVARLRAVIADAHEDIVLEWQSVHIEGVNYDAIYNQETHMMVCTCPDCAAHREATKAGGE